MFFKKGYTMTLNRVHDTVIIRENGESLKLTVNADAHRMVAGLNQAQVKLQELTKDGATDAQAVETAEFFAKVIFGDEQAKQLSEFYTNDPWCIISVCGDYFKKRLSGKITEIQKKLNV